MRAAIIAFALILTGLVWVPAGTTAPDAGTAECVGPSGMQRIVFSAQKFPNVRRHFRGALRRGWPRRLVVIVEGRTPDANERCAISRPVKVSTATSTPQRLAGATGQG
jgi:long-subunit acyl-CoA synthetase (AMP-forming)